MKLIAGVDVGGTFTDVLLYNTETTELELAKVFSTSGMQSAGLMTGLRQTGAPLDRLDAVVHGTTVATNAVLERKGARTALVVTTGFRDVLELRRRDRPTTYGLTGTYVPLIPRSLSFEIDERIGADGQVVTALEDSVIDDLVDRLRTAEVQSVAICLMNSYVNAAHEERLAARLRTSLPDISVTTSAEVAPESGEFERASTTAVNAFVGAGMTRYLDAVQDELESEGFANDVQVMQSNGGVMPVRRAGPLAVRTLLSGPAAGTMGAAAFGRAAGLPDVISCDMGGTSFDVALIPDGQPTLTAESSIEYGIPLRVPMIAITTIGAGGGSIASIDRAGILQVGPESAGSTPGPACYGRGGTRPTVTDANIVLGRIAADQKLGTQTGFSLDQQAAVEAIREHVADPLAMSIADAALAIVRLANERMAGAIRGVSVDKGHDPRQFALIGFGGAGPLHVAELARIIGATKVLVPPNPGALSAYGCLIADVKYDFVSAVAADLASCTADHVARVLADQAQRGLATLSNDGFAEADTTVEHAAEMHFSKQMHTIRVPLGHDENGWTPDRLEEAFLAAYRELYGGRIPASPVRVASLRTVVQGKRNAVGTVRTSRVGDGVASEPRAVVFEDGAHVIHEIDRTQLGVGDIVEGPTIIVQTDSTVLLPPKATAVVHESGSLIVEVNQ
ncbi:MAG: hydantoinase/oxoprolinase family protein [Streptosporangiales bacterium]|nr:hydantoinase/oxoprolinase family protein [Streptosporangiales bacterium]